MSEEGGESSIGFDDEEEGDESVSMTIDEAIYGSKSSEAGSKFDPKESAKSENKNNVDSPPHVVPPPPLA